MTAAKGDAVLRHIRRLVIRREAAPPDGDLLTGYVERRDEAAFAALVERHGPAVLGVCQALLRHHQDAEDAFQATFLVLARKADSIRRRECLGSWLHGVACRVARKARAAAARRQAVEAKAVPAPAPSADDLSWGEVRAILHTELAALPARFREPLVLCYLQGLTQEETARQLGWTPATVKGRLQCGRELLRHRLARRGLGLAALGAAALAGQALAAPVPAALAAATVRAVLPVTGETASAAVTALARAALAPLVPAKARVLSALTFLAIALAGGTGLAGYQMLAGPQQPTPGAAAPKPAGRSADGAEADAAPHARTDRYGDPLPEGAIQRLGTLRFRQGGGTIHGLFLSADGKTLVSKTYYGSRTVCAWDVATGKLLHEFPGHYEENRAAALSPDGKTLAIGHDASIRFFDLASGQQVRKLKAPLGEVQGLAFSPDGKTFASGHQNSTVLLWDLEAGKSIARLPAKHNRVTWLAFTRDGKTLVSGDALDPTIRLFDVATRKERHQLTRPNMIRGLALSPDGDLLALGAQEGPISLWDVKTGKLVRELRGAPFVPGVAFSPDGKRLASVELDQTAKRDIFRLWDLTTGKELRRLKENIGPVWSVVFSADGKTLITGSAVIRLWDVATGEERGPAAGNPWYVGTPRLSPDGHTLAYNADYAIRLWDLAAEREAGRLPGDHWSFAFAPDGKTIAGGTDVNKVNLWDIAGRRLLRQLESDPNKDGFEWVAYYHVAFSPDGKLLASAGRALLSSRRDTDEVVQFWDLATGRKLHRLTMKDDKNEFCTVEAVAFSPDGKTLAASGRGQRERSKLRVWDVASGKHLARLSAALNDPADQGPSVSFSQSPIVEPRIVFSPDGKMLAMNRWQKTIPVWEAATGRRRLVLEAHQDSTVCVTFSPDGRTLASASWDNTIRLWDLATGKELRRLTSHRGKANSLVFSADGKTLISAGDDTTILFWDVAAITQRARPQTDQLSATDAESLWAELANNDAAKAYRAMNRLIASSQSAIAFLKKHLQPAPVISRERLARLLTDLDSDRFAVREKASEELEKLGEVVKPELERAAARPQSSLEFRQRVNQIIDDLQVPSGDRLREIRAVEVLEQIGTPEAQEVLKSLATGAPEARLTQEAKVALEHLAKRTAASPVP
jgi:RNA polymerase sigma factor (sigma-70 family)